MFRSEAVRPYKNISLRELFYIIVVKLKLHVLIVWDTHHKVLEKRVTPLVRTLRLTIAGQENSH